MAACLLGRCHGGLGEKDVQQARDGFGATRMGAFERLWLADVHGDSCVSDLGAGVEGCCLWGQESRGARLGEESGVGVSILGGFSAEARCGSEAASSCPGKTVSEGQDKGDEKGHEEGEGSSRERREE